MPDQPALSVAVIVTTIFGDVPVAVILSVGGTVSTPIVILLGVVETFHAVSRTATVAPLSDDVIVRVYRMRSAQIVRSAVPTDQSSGVVVPRIARLVEAGAIFCEQTQYLPSDGGVFAQFTTAVTGFLFHRVASAIRALADKLEFL